MCNCRRMITLTNLGEKLNKALIIIFFIQLFFLILRIIFQLYSNIFISMFSLIALITYYLTCMYMVGGFLTFFVIIDMVYSLTFLLLRLQNFILKLDDKFLSQKYYIASTFIELTYFIFLFVYFVIIYKSYKEFKAIAKEGISGIRRENYAPLRQDDDNDREQNNNAADQGWNRNVEDNNNRNRNNNQGGGFKAFSGKGHAVGGS